MTPWEAEAELCRRVGLWALVLLQAAALVLVALSVPFWPAVAYAGIGGALIGRTVHHLKQLPGRPW